jgi:hypothetical protein
MSMLRVTLRVSLLAIVCAIGLPTLASAQSPRDVLREFGLLGTWATDCSRPSDSDNFYTIYAGTSDGRVRRTYYNTPGREKPYNVYTVTRAIRLPADQLSYQQEGDVNHDKIDVILLKDGSRYKIWSSVTDEGKVLVKEGKFPGSGNDSPWQAKCSDE